MPRIAPLTPQSAPDKSRTLLEGVNSKLGIIPNMMATMAHSPTVLEAYLNFSSTVGRTLSPKAREAIAVTVAESNACNYCLSAHTALGKGAGLSDAELTAARAGSSTDPKLNAILRFARAVNDARGHATDEDVQATRSAGLTDAELTEVVANVALNLFTNYFNHVTDPDIDFPKVTASGARTPAGARA